MAHRHRANLLMLACAGLLAAAPNVPARGASAPLSQTMPATPPARHAETILFVGNSFTFGARSPLWKFRPELVTDLNGRHLGGVPVLFKIFTMDAGLHYDVSVEAVARQGLGFHLKERASLIDRGWDHVVLQDFSTLDRARPGDARALVAHAGQLATMLHAKNPRVDILLTATWARADQVYPATGRWHGQKIEDMARDIRLAYDAAASASPYIRGVIPVGEAWNRAFVTGFADPDPYDGIAAGTVNLWARDNHHASIAGYYLAALMIFGRVTGRDPVSLGARESAAMALGLSGAQTVSLQHIAQDELAAAQGH